MDYLTKKKKRVLPLRVQTVSMLAIALAHECTTLLVYSSFLRFRTHGRSDTSSMFRGEW